MTNIQRSTLRAKCDISFYFCKLGEMLALTAERLDTHSQYSLGETSAFVVGGRLTGAKAIVCEYAVQLP